jgi:propionyl-CoA synthetase
MGRIDDVINVSGHRLSTGEMEEIVADHPAVAECAVVGIADELKGQRPVGFVVLKDGYEDAVETLEQDLVKTIREKVGAIAVFKTVVVVKRLPKTRSGKTLRKVIRKMADGEQFKMPSTIEDPKTLDEIRENLKQMKVGVAFKG